MHIEYLHIPLHLRKNENKTERREYFRIDDEIALDYRLIKQAEVESLVERIHARFPDRFTVGSTFAATSRQMAQAMHKAQAQSPDLARCLQAMPAHSALRSWSPFRRDTLPEASDNRISS